MTVLVVRLGKSFRRIFRLGRITRTRKLPAGPLAPSPNPSNSKTVDAQAPTHPFFFSLSSPLWESPFFRPQFAGLRHLERAQTTLD